MLLFLTTKMAPVTLPANQKYKGSLFIISKNIQEHKPSMLETANVYLLAIKFKLHHVLALSHNKHGSILNKHSEK